MSDFKDTTLSPTVPVLSSKEEALSRIESTHSAVINELANGEAISYDELPIIEVSVEENRRVIRKLDLVCFNGVTTDDRFYFL